MNCIVVDDEPLALDLLEDNVKKIPFLNLIARCTNALEAIEVIQTEPVDLVITDIQMPGLSGIQLIEGLPVRPLFIIITAYERHAVEGFNLDVVDYLLKPASFDRFVKAINKAKEQHFLRGAAFPDPKKAAREFIFLNADYSAIKVMFKDILMIEGLKDYLKVVFADGRAPLVTRATLRSLEHTLPSQRFIRIHKSYIVNVDYISSVRKNCIYLGKTELPVSEAYKNGLDQFVNNNL